MPKFEDCRIEVKYSGDDAPDFDSDDCELTLDSGTIAVVYFDNEGAVIFAGHETTPGCFELVCRSRPRVASLERRGDTLEGSWEEPEARGSWRILLPSGAVG